MGRKQKQDDLQKQPSKSLRTKAAHFVSDLTTGLLNPVSDKPSTPPPPPSSSDDLNNSENKQSETEGLKDSADGPDTSSFTAFLYSFIAPSESRARDEKSSSPEDDFAPPSEPMTTKENAKKKSLFSRGKQSLGKALNQAARIGGFRSQSMKGKPDLAVGDGGDSKGSRDDGIALKILNEAQPAVDLNLPEISEPSLLMSEKTRSLLYGALPVIIQGRKWMLLYRLRLENIHRTYYVTFMSAGVLVSLKGLLYFSTWRHGISLSTLYRRSMIWPGLSLLVVILPMMVLYCY